MLYSKLFGKTLRNVSKQFESKSHELLTKAGYIDQVASGIFNLLPLGKRVLTKIEDIIRQGMNAIGGQELMMSSLHPKILWQQSGRWETVEILYKIQSQYGQEYALAPTHEETITPLAKKFIKSYRDLPLALYHITSKFRDEPRPKSGILRGREFGMKDLYSFHTSNEDLHKFYQIVTKAYLKIFSQSGLKDVKISEAAGGSFTNKFSHEFNVITVAGEVNLIYCDNCSFAQNEEISTVKTDQSCPKCKMGKIKKDRAIEVGNIFDLGIKFSQAFDLKYTDENGKGQLPVMGCYGIGTSRLIGAIVEIYSDEKGIIWPESVAPYQVHLIGLDIKDKNISPKVHKVYKVLKEKNIEVLFDDREETTAGEKFADADLIGIPNRLVISKRTGDKVEYKERKSKVTRLIELSEILSMLKVK